VGRRGKVVARRPGLVPKELPVRLRIGTVAAAAALFLAGAIGLLGPWALGTAVVVLVASSVATAIAWDDSTPVQPVSAVVAPDRRRGTPG
jgi:hypothetical protein